jgi:hypothetical protein
MMMASQKVRPTALRRFFRTSTYLMHAFAPEKPPSLVGRNFCLANLCGFESVSMMPHPFIFFLQPVQSGLRDGIESTCRSHKEKILQ